MTMFYNFTEEVNGWLSDAGHQYVQSCGNDILPPDKQSVSPDDFNPEDSASNVSCLMKNHSRTQFQLSKAALMERMAALKRKCALKAIEEELRKEKEQLVLETEMAEANTKLHVLEINSKCGSK